MAKTRNQTQQEVKENNINIPESEVKAMISIMADEADFKLFERVIRGQAIHQIVAKLSKRISPQSNSDEVMDDFKGESEIPGDEEEYPDGY